MMNLSTTYHRAVPVAPKKAAKRRGFTLLELIATIALILILISVAVPSFAAMLTKASVMTKASSLYETLYLARNEALNRQQIVHVCQISSHETSCDTDYGANRDWSQGWLIFADENENNRLDSGEPIIKSVYLDGATPIIFNQRGRLRFFPNGSARGAGFYLCDRELRVMRHIYLLHSGRARIDTRLSQRQRKKCADL